MEDLEKARALAQDIQLRSRETLDITNTNVKQVCDMRKGYLEGTSNKDTSLAIEELLQSTRLTKEEICGWLRCDSKAEKRIRRKKNTLAPKEIGEQEVQSSGANSTNSIELSLWGENISIAEARKLLDSLEDLGISSISIEINTGFGNM